ncbi:hypothetical protein Hanom_Chr05g00390121 [Helianthus anomalus]
MVVIRIFFHKHKNTQKRAKIKAYNMYITTVEKKFNIKQVKLTDWAKTSVSGGKMRKF